MKESFNKFRKKMLFEALIKSSLIGLSVALIVVTIPKLIVHFGKINISEFFDLILLLLFNVIFILVFGLLFLITFPKELKVAKRLDKDLGLNQKVQTMIEFEHDDSTIVNLQREDTLNILSNISLKKLGMKFSVFFFVLIGLACALGITVAAVEVYEKPPVVTPEPEEPKYDLDNWTVRALLDLIEVVETSNVEKDLKDPVVNNLKELLNSLETVELESEMKKLVTEIIADSLLRLDLINSNNEVFNEIKSSSSSLVKDIAVQINALNVSNVNNCIENIYVYLCGDPTTTSGALLEFDNDFRTVIVNSKLNKEERLTKALLDFGNELKSLEGQNNLSEAVEVVISKHKENILNILRIQAENKLVIEYVVSQLEIIFGLKEPEINDNEGDGTENKGQINETEPPKVNEGEFEGGYGTGEVLFGSDDIIFDIEKGSVEYGEVISKYYGTLIGMFNDGTLPEEYKELFDKYFDGLFGFYEEE